MTRQELAKKIYDIAYLRGEFKLRSGQTSNEYFDKYRFEAEPELLREIAKQMKPLIPAGTEILAGLEMGGIPIATALSLETGIPALFVRKKAKDYGTCRIAEGRDFSGKKVCIIEDVITTGGQVLLSAEDLRKAGAKISDVLCVIHRGEGKPLEKADLSLTPLFTKSELTS
ncbi:MAG: orotate phosphoribosyltransferase [Bdellovibrionaceae bacterium]|nr:orotate phosphoribosyltransferase [Pseudobdellovibrionaceae bacterium]